VVRVTIKALRLVDAIPVKDGALPVPRRDKRKPARKKEWAFPMTGPDGKEYLLPFKLLKEIARKDIQLRKLRALKNETPLLCRKCRRKNG
jgi:hypothetical protein